MAKHPASTHANPAATTDNSGADPSTAEFGIRDQAHLSPEVLAAAKTLGAEYSAFVAKHRAAKPKATATTVAGDQRTRPSQRQQDQEPQCARGEARMTTAPVLQPAGTPDQCMVVTETGLMPIPTGIPTNLGARMLPTAPLLTASNGAANNLGLQTDSSLSKKRRTGLTETDWKTMDYQDTESE